MADPANTGIYEIVNLINGKRYVGSALSFRNRFASHRHSLRLGKHHSRFLQNSWSKHGEQSFSFRKLIICRPADLVFYEQIVIDSTGPEYNICRKAGSCLGVKWTKEAKEKQSEIQSRVRNFLGRKHTPETLALMSASQKGRPSPMKGRKRNPEAVTKTAAAHRGSKRSEETRSKMSAIRAGTKMPPRSAEYRAKISASLKGKQKSPEHMAALQAGRNARVYTEDQKLKISESMRAAYADGRKSRNRPPEYREKIRNTLTGRKLTPEHRANVARAMSGKKRGPYKLRSNDFIDPGGS